MNYKISINIASFLFISVIIYSFTSVQSQIDSASIIFLANISMNMSWVYVFEEDFSNGCLEQIFICKKWPMLTILEKIINHWIIYGIVISLVSCMLYFMLSDVELPNCFIINSLLNTFLISFIGSTSSSIILGKANSTTLIPVITIPLSIPAITLININLHLGSYFNPFTLIISIFTIIVCTCATYLALKISVT